MIQILIHTKSLKKKFFFKSQIDLEDGISELINQFKKINNS